MDPRPLPPLDRIREIFSYDHGRGCLIRVKTKDPVVVWMHKSREGKKLHPKVRIDGKMYLYHRVVWKLVTTLEPSGDLDHKDLDVWNPSFENLRPATQSENLGNRLLQKNNTSGFAGVGWKRRAGLWSANITHEGERICLGRYRHKSSAIAVYIDRHLKLFGAFSIFNDVSGYDLSELSIPSELDVPHFMMGEVARIRERFDVPELVSDRMIYSRALDTQDMVFHTRKLNIQALPIELNIYRGLKG